MGESKPLVDWQPPGAEENAPSSGTGTAVRRVGTWTPARVAAVLIALVSLDYLVDGLLSFQGIGLLNDLEHVTDAQLVAFDASVATVGRIGLGLFIAAGIAFLFWERRVFTNIRASAGARVTSPNMAVVWWFVPFANFVKVPRVMQEAREEVWDGLRSPSRSLVVGWWVAYLVANVLTTLYARLPAPTTVGEYTGQQGLNIAGDVFYLIAAALAIRIILDVERGARAQMGRAAIAAGPDRAPADIASEPVPPAEAPLEPSPEPLPQAPASS